MTEDEKKAIADRLRAIRNMTVVEFKKEIDKWLVEVAPSPMTHKEFADKIVALMDMGNFDEARDVVREFKDSRNQVR